jgi:glycosyltransferase involved in cell wall biosynthesis
MPTEQNSITPLLKKKQEKSLDAVKYRKKKILLIGPYPPPYGGVSVHILRFKNLLKDSFNFNYIDESGSIKKEYFNLRSLKIFTYIKAIANTEIIFVHSGNLLVRLFHVFMGKMFSKKTILVLHGFTSKPPKIVFHLLGLIYRSADLIIAVNSDIKSRLKLPAKKCVIKEAFIPPVIKDEPELPEDISNLLNKYKKQGITIICANAFRLEKYKNQDLYGLDLCIEVTKRLVEKKVPFIFIFVVSSIEQNSDLYYKSESLIKELNLNEHFFLINERLSFVKLMQESDIIVRPTNTDGDSLTIREALFLNKKILTSDVVERPAGVILFKNRDIDDLEIQLETLLSRKNDGVNSTKNYNQLNEELKKFYSDLIYEI